MVTSRSVSVSMPSLSLVPLICDLIRNQNYTSKLCTPVLRVKRWIDSVDHGELQALIIYSFIGRKTTYWNRTHLRLQGRWKGEIKRKVISLGLKIIYIGCCYYSFVSGRAFVKYSSDEVAIILVRQYKVVWSIGLRSNFLMTVGGIKARKTWWGLAMMDLRKSSAVPTISAMVGVSSWRNPIIWILSRNCSNQWRFYIGAKGG